MESFKSPASRLARLFKRSRNAWKTKALDRQQRLRAAQVRIRDLEKSRAYWKERALTAEGGACASPQATPGDGEAQPEEPPREALCVPARHQDSVMVIALTLQLYLHTGLGRRGVRRVLELLAPWQALAGPGSTTVLNWLYRCGLGLLQRAPERREDWIYVIERPASAQMSQVSGYDANSALSPPGQDHRRTLLVNAARGRCLRRRWRLVRVITIIDGLVFRLSEGGHFFTALTTRPRRHFCPVCGSQRCEKAASEEGII
jgi:hypothetical protein